MIHKLSLNDVTKKYGIATALNPVSLHVEEGEFVTLLGPSGSGKSTLLKIIAGMTSASSGRVFIDGRDATNIPSRERDLGMVFQNYALMPHMNVFENVAFPLRVRKASSEDIKKKVAWALDVVQLGHLADRKPAALSGGQQQRVAIARAIVYDPSLVLMDEPLGALDKKLREQLQSEIKQLHQKLGITIVYVTHDQEEAMSMSDRVAVMNAGSLEQIGAPRDLYFKPKTAFSAQFLGNSNFLKATFVGTENSMAKFQLPSGEHVLAPSGHSLQHGEKVRLMVRPEHIGLGEGVIKQNLNQMKAIATDVSFLGGSVHYKASAEANPALIIVGDNLGARASCESGKPITLFWDPSMTLVFAGEQIVE